MRGKIVSLKLTSTDDEAGAIFLVSEENKDDLARYLGYKDFQDQTEQVMKFTIDTQLLKNQVTRETAERPSWDTVFMEVAGVISKRGTCPRLKVGAVITVDNKIVSTGYNGAPADSPHCSEVGCMVEKETGRCKRTVHAEINAIIQAGKLPETGAVLYTTHFPCVECASVIANTKIEKVVYLDNEHYPDDRTQRAREILTMSLIELQRFSET